MTNTGAGWQAVTQNIVKKYGILFNCILGPVIVVAVVVVVVVVIVVIVVVEVEV